MFFQKRTIVSDAGEDREPVWNLTEKKKKQKKKIAVVGISRGAGTTFVSVSLAFLLASVENEKQHIHERKLGEQSISPARVSLLELRRPKQGETMLYYEAGLDRRFQGRRFTDFFSLFQNGDLLPQAVNLHKGINWIVWRQPAEPDEPAKTGRQPAASSGEGSRFDWSGFPMEQMPGAYLIADSPPLDMLQKYDLVIGVINPLPSAVYAGAERYEILRDLEAAGLPVLWAVNRDCPEVNHAALKRFLRLKGYVSIPELDWGLFCRAQYSGQLAAELAGELATEETAGMAAGTALRELAEQVRSRLQTTAEKNTPAEPRCLKI